MRTKELIRVRINISRTDLRVLACHVTVDRLPPQG